MHGVKVAQLRRGRPGTVATCVGLLSGRRPGEELFQVAGEQFALGQVLVGGAEHRVSALTTLGEDLGERRLAVSSVHAVEGGLLPPFLGSRLAGHRIRIRFDVVVLKRKKDRGFVLYERDPLYAI